MAAARCEIGCAVAFSGNSPTSASCGPAALTSSARIPPPVNVSYGPIASNGSNPSNNTT
ncbi:hypothetical protein [Lentzea indica]|uniref:hypothetical protein n=1 Tax=Lentzea indica TaxID=2604800 RepID=UPI0014399474|nr:hypothetical protein [Lentzea indica]